MYHVKAIGIISLIIYFLSLAGNRLGVITKRDHRSFWNIILLISFISTALAGLFLALHTIYKWELEAIEKILKWHVEFGISLSFVGIFHITWHLNYFRNIFAKDPDKLYDFQKPDQPRAAVPGTGASLFLIGFLTGAVQLIFLKELLNLAGGYELAAGSFFCGWLLTTAAGSFLGKNSKNLKTGFLLFLTPALGLFSFAIMILLYRTLTFSGQTPSFITTIIITIISIAPFCLSSGVLFVKLSETAFFRSKTIPGISFARETAGSILAGLFVSVLSAGILDNYQQLFVVLLISFGALSAINKSRNKKWILVAVAILATCVLIVPPDKFIRKFFFRNIPIVSSRDSRYGNISVADYLGQKTTFYNHRVYNFGGDIAAIEENIHYPLMQHPNPSSVLLISGGLKQHYNEIIKYKSICEVTYIELDPSLIATDEIEEFPPSRTRLTVAPVDAIKYLKREENSFDVIIIALPEPDNYLINRYYTTEFYEIIKSRLNDGGIVMTRVTEGQIYPGEEAMSFISTTYNSLKSMYANVLPVRSNSIFMLASDDSIRTDYTRMLSGAGLSNQFMNTGYINDQILQFNSNMIINSIDTNAVINTLNRPVSIYINQNRNIKKNGIYQTAVVVLISISLIVIALVFKFDRKRIFLASFSVAGLEIMALILYQSVVGYMYQSTGLIIALTMTGLATGSFFSLKWSFLTKDNIAMLMGLTFLIALLLNPIMVGISSVTIFHLFLTLLIFIPSCLTGILYRILTCGMKSPGIISVIYGSDLLGAALGFLLFSGIIIPLIGINSTLIILVIINFSVYLTGLFKSNEI